MLLYILSKEIEVWPYILLQRPSVPRFKDFFKSRAVTSVACILHGYLWLEELADTFFDKLVTFIEKQLPQELRSIEQRSKALLFLVNPS